MRIELTGIRCRYGSTPAVDGVDLTIEDGEFLALLGPSGSGKTTLLRVLAGLEVPEEGRIRIGGEDALDIPPNKRQVGFVFQNYALFRHMTVARNIAFGLAIRPSRDRPAHGVIGARVDELLDLVQLPGYGSRYPQQLSGGQQQRVALARALATEPRILLLDEPFGALDTKVRTELRVWLKELHRRLGVTAVFVTHDQEEALELADRIVVMRAGRIEQAGTPAEIYAAPASAFVYDFLGEANRLACRVEAGRALGASGLVLADRVALPDGPAMAWFRPEAVEIAAAGGAGWIEATATDITGIGPHGRIMFEHEGGLLTAKLPAQTLAASGIATGKPFGWRPREVRVYPTG